MRTCTDHELSTDAEEISQPIESTCSWSSRRHRARPATSAGPTGQRPPTQITHFALSEVWQIVFFQNLVQVIWDSKLWDIELLVMFFYCSLSVHDINNHGLPFIHVTIDLCVLFSLFYIHF